MNLKKKILLLWVIFALLDPDPLTRLDPDPIRIRIRIQSGSGYGSGSATLLFFVVIARCFGSGIIYSRSGSDLLIHSGFDPGPAMVTMGDGEAEFFKKYFPSHP
jgi:hypothetical protein